MARDKYCNDYAAGEQVTEFFFVKEARIRQTKTGKYYGQLELADCKGSISAKKWDPSADDMKMFNQLKPGSIVKVQAKVEEFNGNLQMIVERIRLATEADAFEKADLIRMAPMEGDYLYKCIMRNIDSYIRDEDYKRLCNLVYEREKERLLYWPAGKAIHHDEMCGLLWHTYRMADAALRLCTVYPSMNQDLLLAGVILHDIGKIYEIESDEYGVSPGYTMEGSLLGHLVMGVKIIEKYATECGMPDEKKVLLEHMLASHHGKPEYDAAHKPCLMEAQILHEIDMIDMYVYVGEKEMEKVDEGEFTDKVFVYSNMRLYRPKSGKGKEEK